MWKFLDYVRDDKIVPVYEWYEGLLADERAAFDVTIDILERTDYWELNKRLRDRYLPMQRELVGLTELKFDLSKREHGKNSKRRFRPVGFMKQEVRIFILLGGFQKGKKQPIPPDAFERILKTKAEYESGRGSFRVHAT